MWWSKKKLPETDIPEALQVRAEAREDLAQLKNQASYVSELASRLIERRTENHFGEDITITFLPRGGKHA